MKTWCTDGMWEQVDGHPCFAGGIARKHVFRHPETD
jgi:hypothetical protein